VAEVERGHNGGHYPAARTQPTLRLSVAGSGTLSRASVPAVISPVHALYAIVCRIWRFMSRRIPSMSRPAPTLGARFRRSITGRVGARRRRRRRSDLAAAALGQVMESPSCCSPTRHRGGAGDSGSDGGIGSRPLHGGPLLPRPSAVGRVPRARGCLGQVGFRGRRRSA
jgi:hypothetical protein